MSDTIRLPAGLGEIVEVERWLLNDGAELRVVRWHLSRGARAVLEWSRGDDLAAPPPGEWLGGVALDRRDPGARRWSTMRRQEQATDDLDRLTARVDGWQYGLVARAEKLARAGGD